MYAQSKRSNIYHLLYSTVDYTLCGQKLNPENPNEGLGLRLIPEEPPNNALCKQCEKMEQRRNTKAKAAGP